MFARDFVHGIGGFNPGAIQGPSARVIGHSLDQPMALGRRMVRPSDVLLCGVGSSEDLCVHYRNAKF